MLVSGVSLDLNWFLQLIFTFFIVAVGLLHLVKNTASKYFEVDANFEGEQPSDRTSMPGVLMDDSVCAVCGNFGNKKCSRCKAIRYCSQKCQQSDWKSGHKTKCKDIHLAAELNLTQTAQASGFKASDGGKNLSAIALVPARSSFRPVEQPKNGLFPYDEFVKFFNWEKTGFSPCGLLNCGNSCFANVVLQCLSFTKPLVAYLLDKGHRGGCRRNDWCFLCEFQTHVERASQSSQAFSPMNILSRLPNIGGTLGYGRQEDAHEFMRFAIDMMQSVCLYEFGGEKAVHPNLQETTLIQHIFGGHLQSQVFCTKCEKISNQYENMMDLTVEIQGDAASLEECLEQFTAKEWLHGENMYKCDGCNEYVKAWKRLTIKRAPNILTIALKRFQSGRFGKLNKRITFPEMLDLSPYMSDAGDGSDIYKLYAVVVHVDMLNASFFGHYICYIKDFQGNWYRIDDWKVMNVELEEVLSQGAYMLLYTRVSARPSGLQTTESSGKAEEQAVVSLDVEPGSIQQAECLSSRGSVASGGSSEVFLSNNSPESIVYGCENKPLTEINSDVKREHSENADMVDMESTSDFANKIQCSAVEETSGRMEGHDDTNMAKSGPSPGLPNQCSTLNKDSYVSLDFQSAREDSEHTDTVKLLSKAAMVNGNGYASPNKSAIPLEDTRTVCSGNNSFPTETFPSGMHLLKRGLPLYNSDTDEGNGIKRVEISGDNS
ncbi:hypothetical protein L6164_024415 [Bauhinia variegata]|uniref:Uncharacterized protein n=1 Tax=Bauhinia variegata TaxID=167791 RepID=A0ACB9LYM9_BAUVA|nr:hypothetical protein L6164_024415 [Bauhinia variegata]